MCEVFLNVNPYLFAITFDTAVGNITYTRITQKAV